MQDQNIGSVGPEEAARILGIGRTMLFSLLANGELRSFRLGRRRLIARAELQRFLDTLTAQAA